MIFENAYLTDDEKIRACRLTEAAGGDFVKTSTGFAPSGATHDDLRLMRANTSPHVQVKAAGGVRTLDALLAVMELGVTRIGATATEAIILDFRARKAGRTTAAGVPGRGGGLLMHTRADRDAGLRLHRGVPRPGAALRARRRDHGQLRRERRAARGLRRAVRRPGVRHRRGAVRGSRRRPRGRVAAQPPAPRGGAHARPPPARRSRAPSRSAATRTRRPTCCAP